MSQRGLPEAIGVVLLLAFWSTQGMLQVAIGGLVLFALGVLVAAGHPRLVRDGLAVTLGLAPAADLAGVPLVFLGIAGLGVIAVREPGRRVLGPLETVTIGLLLACLASVLVVRVAWPDDAVQYLSWALPTALPLLLLNLAAAELVRFARLYAYGAAGGATIGVLVATVDKSHVLMKPFKPLGYDTTVVQYFLGTGAPVERLSATYLNPNAAGIFLLIGFVFCLAFFRGRRRAVLTVLIGAGLALALSRAALGGLVIGALLVVLVHPMDSVRRTRTLGAMVLAGVAAILTPPVRARLLDSFGSSDAGTAARGQALRQLPGQLEGHWVFGLGWGRPEFVSEVVTAQVNFVANSPLLTVYRAGVIAGAFFTALLVVGVVQGWRALRSRSWEAACLGGGFIGFALVTLQLDFPVVTAYPLTAIFMIFLVMVQRAPDIAEATS